MGAFGNVPDVDVQIVGQCAAMASEVARAVPSGAPSEWVAVTYEAVLGAALRYWVEDQEEAEFDDEDAEDLGNIVRAAADIALQQEPAFQSIAFKTILKGWLEDWLQNWVGTEE